MKIYFSLSSKKKIKKHYKYLIDKDLAFIDVPVIARSFNHIAYNGDICADYVLSQELEKRIKLIYESKKYTKIVYILDKISIGFVSNFKKYVESKNIFFTDYILIDYNQNDNSLYKYFDNII